MIDRKSTAIRVARAARQISNTACMIVMAWIGYSIQSTFGMVMFGGLAIWGIMDLPTIWEEPNHD